MKTYEDTHIRAFFLDDKIVLVRAHFGVEITAASARVSNGAIAQEMPGDYGMIIDRQEDYSIVPMEVYDVLNSIDHLKAIALVMHRPSSMGLVPMEKSLFKGPLALFDSVGSAEDWMRELLAESTEED